MKKVLKGNIYFLIILMLEILAPFLLNSVYALIGIRDVRIALFLNHTILFIIPAIIYVIVTKCNIKETFKFKRLPFKDVILVIILALFCTPIMNFFGLLSAMFFENNIGNLITSISSTPYVILMLLIAVMPAITEEITIRGVVLAGYDDENIYVSAVVTGLFFGIMHLDGQQFLYAVALGIILALVVRITKSIFSSMIIHFIINGTSVTMSKLTDLLPASKEELQVASEITLTDLPNSVILGAIFFYAILTVICFVAIYFIFKKLILLNVTRNIITREEVRLKKCFMKSIKDAINLPFILIIAIYIIYMSFFS